MLRRQYYLDATESHSRKFFFFFLLEFLITFVGFLTEAASSESTSLYSAGMVVGIISFCVGLAVLALMEFLKLKIEHESLSVGVAPEVVGKFNPDLVEQFEDSANNHDRGLELRPGESTSEDAHRQRILDDHADSRKQWQQQQQLSQEPLSSKTKGSMPTKLMAAVAMRNAAQEAVESDDDAHEDDHSDHDSDSVFSFPSAISGMSED